MEAESHDSHQSGPSQPDYPAAHSMDSSWFAVDADGRIGFFNTCEPGPLPVEFKRGGDPGLLRSVFLTTPWVLLANIGSAPDAMRHESYIGCWPLGMLLRTREALGGLGNEYETGPIFTTPDGEVVPACFPELDMETFDRLHEEKACLGCIDLFNIGERTKHMGGYYYTAGGNYSNGPYARGEAPAHLIRLGDLPPEVQRQAARVRFDALKFERTLYLQPLEHMPCQTWGLDTYLGSDLKTFHPIVPPSFDFRSA